MWVMIRNYWTTVAGLLGALVVWMQGIGVKWPVGNQEWTAALIALVIALLGVFSKDATTGSTPPRHGQRP